MMMTQSLVPIIVAAAAVLVTALVCAAALSAWRGWLALKEQELLARHRGRSGASGNEADDLARPAAMIEMAGVKERLRRLEAIASGVEL